MTDYMQLQNIKLVYKFHSIVNIKKYHILRYGRYQSRIKNKYKLNNL